MTKFTKSAITTLTVSGTILLSAAAHAETTLKALDGSFSLQGDLLSYEDGTYVIQTVHGDLQVSDAFVSCEGEDCPSPVVGADQERSTNVILSAPGGDFTLEGQLVSASDTSYVIDTEAGELTVRRELVTCSGSGCPTTIVVSDAFAVAVPPDLGTALLTSIVSDFAASKEFSMTRSIETNENFATLLVGDDKGAEVASISVNTLTNADAILSVINGDVAFAMTNEQVTPDMLSEITGTSVRDISSLLTETTIGLDAVAFVINQENRLAVMNTDSVRDIVSGKITNWSDMGGADAPINVHLLNSDTGLMRQLDSRVMVGEEVATQHTLHDSVDELNSSIQADRNALGVMYRSQAADVRPIDLVNNCNIFHDSDDFAIQTEEYPFAIRWYQYSAASAELPQLADDISNYMVTDFGQRSIASQGFVTQELRVVPMKDQGARLLSTVLASGNNRVSNSVMRAYLAEASQAERLSTSLRFLSGATSLDAKARDDVRRISGLIRSKQYEGYEVLVFGFTDSYGSSEANLLLAKARAEAVKTNLLNENVGFLDASRVLTFGIGPIAPIACDDTARGRQLNRRVEIWIRPQSK